ncbi:MAG: thiopurine S-methyltransferase [Proteobacteria bacterium]|nr:MAG: thiopurine S-methyltransferase [Pseudomonadota bacterium]
MEQEFWHRRWQKNEIGFHESKPNDLLVNHLNQLSLAPHSRIFLPLCGKTLDIDWLLAQGHHVVGVELNHSAVEQLFQRLNLTPNETMINKHLTCYKAANICIFQGDIFKLTAQQLGPVDAVYDRAALVALPEALRLQYSRHMLQLCPKTPQLLIVFNYDQKQMAGPPFSVSEQTIHQYYNAVYDIENLSVREVAGGLRNVAAKESAWLLNPK